MLATSPSFRSMHVVLKNKSFTLKLVLFAAICISVVLFYYKGRILAAAASGDTGAALLYNFKRVTGLFEFSWNAIIMNILVVAGCLLLEMMFTGWDNSSLKRLLFQRNGSTTGDLWCWLLSVFYLYRIFVIIFSFGIFYAAVSFLVNTYHIHLLSYISSPWLQFIIIVVLADLKHFVRHFISHKVGFLWELHKYHHSATEMNMITSERGHFLEAAYISFFDALLFILLGAPMQMFLFLVTFRQVHIMFVHSNVSWNWGWVGKYILVSPRAHRLHHSTATEHHNSNYGSLFIFWDRILNTWYNPEKAAPKIDIGLTPNPFNTSHFFSDMITGYKEFLNKLFVQKNGG